MTNMNNGPTITTNYDLGWYGKHTRSSDSEAFRSKDVVASAARDVARTSDYGSSIRRTLIDNIVGPNLKMIVTLDAKALGITPEQATEVSDAIQREFKIHAEGPSFGADAMHMQTLSGLIRTACASYIVSGEALGSVEWKPTFGTPYATCLNLIEPERLSDPNGSIDPISGRRMGVWRDYFGEPIAYSIRRHMPSDSLWSMDVFTWDVFPRRTDWGRPIILHAFEHDRAEMTRGISSMTNVIEPLRYLRKFMETELDANAVRAEFAAVIRAEINYEQAMGLMGQDAIQSVKQNGFMDFNLAYMKQKVPFHEAQDFQMGKAKVVHLLPNEHMELLHSQQAVGSLKEMADVNLYGIASGAGVSYSSLTKNYSQVNYSGGRMEAAEVERSYSVRRDDFFSQFVVPFAFAWLEEAVVVRQTIKLPGSLPYYDAVKYITIRFEVRGKTRLDPLKEAQAEIALLQVGATSLKNICDANNLDWTEVLEQRAQEKALMDRLGLKPEDMDWSLIINQGSDAASGATAESK